MFLFRCKSCLNNISRCFMKFEAKWTTPVVWAEIQLKYWHWMFTYWAATLYPGPLFTSEHNRITSFKTRNRLTYWKPDLVELCFPPFGTPFADFFRGKWAKMEYLANNSLVLPHFCCNDIVYQKVDYAYKNVTTRVSWWWDVTDWWWKVGFTPRAIRHVHLYWQFQAWVLSTSGCQA